MRRIISAQLSATLFALLLAAPVGAADNGPTTICTRGAVESLAGGTVIVDKRHLGGTDPDSTVNDCEFRLYDDNDENDPEIPHVFTTDDWFLGGTFEWVSRSEMEAFGFDRADAVAYLDSIEEHLLWRELGGEWAELPLTQTSRRSMRAPWGEVLTVLQHRYHIFAAGSLEPGVYEWRWEIFDPLYQPGAASGEVHIVAN